jgi:SAM-dependent methyltransferase
MRSKTNQQSSINHSVYQKNKTVLEYLVESTDLYPGEQAVISRHQAEISGVPVLDIGVGAGRTTAAMLELTGDYLGIDFSEAMIAACKTRFPNAKFLHCDARNMEHFGENRYGFIWYSFNGLDCLNHEERQAVIGQIFKMLKPGGLFFFSSHNLEAAREKPFQLSLYQWNWHPRKLLKNFALMSMGMLNYLRYKRFHIEQDSYAILTDSGHEFGCLHYYVDPQEQLRRLKRAGFKDAQTLAWSGVQFPPTHQNIKRTPHVYYLARKQSEAVKL